jgi:hypothetical protein
MTGQSGVHGRPLAVYASGFPAELAGRGCAAVSVGYDLRLMSGLSDGLAGGRAA